METLLKDLRYGVRSFLKRPGFLVIAISTLALGIGATTAMFTVVNSVLLRPLQFPEPETIVLLEGINPRQGITQSNMSIPDIADWQQQSQSFEQIAAFVTGGVFISTGEETERVRATAVSTDFFPLFRTNPITGRAFQADDMQEGREPVAVISHALWQRRFGGSADVVNKKVTVQGKATTIVGIMPPGFTYPGDSEMWVPFPLNPAKEERVNRYVSAVSRLKPNVSIAQAQAEMDTINQRLAQNYVRDKQRLECSSNRTAGTSCWRVANLAADTFGCSCICTSNRVRERCEPSARACCLSSTGDRSADSAGCESAARRASTLN